jgi:periplasmic protein TonB
MRTSLGNMNIYSKPLQLSVLFHGIILLALILLNTSPTRYQNVLVIDFTSGNEPLLREVAKSPSVSHPAKLQRNIKNNHLLAVDRHQKNIEEESTITPVPSDMKNVMQNEPQNATRTLSENKPFITMGSDAFSSVGSQSGAHESGSQKTAVSANSDGRSGDVIRSDKSPYTKAHFSYIKDLIYKHLIYPVIAKRMGWEGTVITTFVVSPEGYAKDVKVSKSSGHEILDENAVKAIKNASPFPKPPVEAQIIIPILYRLN